MGIDVVMGLRRMGMGWRSDNLSPPPPNVMKKLLKETMMNETKSNLRKQEFGNDLNLYFIQNQTLQSCDGWNSWVSNEPYR